MKKPLLTKRFFKENPLDKMSAALISDFALSIQFNDELNAELERILSEQLPEDRKIQIAKDKEEVEKLDSGEAVVRYMRKNHEPVVDPMFCKKALALETAAAPLIVKRYKTTAQTRFVELAFRVLLAFDEKYTQQLFEEYQEIRSPYAKAMACLMFGEQHMEGAEPLLLEEYRRFKREYPRENYDQHPLMALYILYGRA